MVMITNAYAGRATMDENCMRLMIEDSDKNVSEIWVYKVVNPVCRFSLEDNDRVLKEGAIDWDRASALISANRSFDIEYEYYELPGRLIATSIHFRDDTPKKGSIVVTDKSTAGFELLINGPMTMAADVAIHIKGSLNTLWMTLRTECLEYYKKPEIGIKRIGNMQAFDILRKAANGEYKSYEIKFNYHIKESDSWRLMVDEVYIKYEEKEESEKLKEEKSLLNSMYGISALGWSDMWPTSMIDIPSRQNGKMARLKEFVKKCNLTVPECLYCRNDIVPIWTDDGLFDDKKEPSKFLIPKIKKVLYNEPAVIVFWEDDTKTVVHAQDGEPYDKEKGLAMAISKKALGNDRSYYETFIRSKAVPRPKKGKKE